MSDTTTPLAVTRFSAWQWGVPLSALLLMAVLWALSGNVTIFLWLNKTFANLGDAFWSHVTIMGDVVPFLLLLLFCGRRPQVIWQMLIATMFAILWTQSLKAPLGVLRPPAVMDIGQIHLIGPMFLNNSFPSGHTTTVFVLAGVLCLQNFHYSLKALFLMMAILVGLSRIACGVHWPMDVLGGAFGGWMAAVLGNWIGLQWRAGLHQNVQRVVALLLFSVAVWVVFRTPTDFIQTREFQVVVAIAALGFSIPALMRLFKLRS